MKNFEINKTDAEWQDILSEEEFRILRKKGTEPAFTGKYHDFNGDGVFVCAACGNRLFSTKSKFDSGTGWPSFLEPAEDKSVETEKDVSLFMERTEVLCSKCGGHLGHVFDDGPNPGGLRYCINSVSLKIENS